MNLTCAVVNSQGSRPDCEVQISSSTEAGSVIPVELFLGSAWGA